MSCLLPLLNRNSLIVSSVLLGLAIPVLAHNIEISGDVAALFHLEPDHNPHAGKPSQVWFALTRKGGALIPLQQCNCQLKVFVGTDDKSGKPILEPALSPINAEQYKGVPSATIVFPKAGIYTLQLTGSPKIEGSFRPFELDYQVTVIGH